MQQTAPSANFPGFERAGNRTPQQQQTQQQQQQQPQQPASQQPNQPAEDFAPLFATLVARCAKDIDVLIDSLPSEDSTSELQVLTNYNS